MDFFERVKQLAKQNKKTIIALLAELEINYDTYNSTRKCGNIPRADEACKIASALNTTVEYLVTGQTSDKQTEARKLAEKLLSLLS